MNFEYEENVNLILEAAAEEAKILDHICVTPEHVLFASIHFPFMHYLFESLQIDINSFRDDLLQYFIDSGRSQISHIKQDDGTRKPELSRGYKKFIEKCCLCCSRDKRSVISIQDLVIALLEVEETQKTHFFKSRNITRQDLVEIMSSKQFVEHVSSGLERHDIMDMNLFNEDYDKFWEKEEQEDEGNVLEFGTNNLSELVKEQHRDPFVGQDSVIDEVFEVFLRRKKNNVLLVGDSGVGKTSLVYELANRINNKDVPVEFHDTTVVSLNILFLVAGTRYRGDFEERIKQLIQAFSTNKSCILLLDDIQTIFNTGATSNNTNDFGDLIKPLLYNKDLRCIGTCTYNDYKKFELERGMFRHFFVIEMQEASDTDTLDILKQLQGKYESFYNVQFSDPVLQKIIELSKKYIYGRAFPDKAIDVLDAVGSSVKLKKNFGSQKKKKMAVTIDDIERVTSKITKRSLTSIKKNEFRELLSLEKRIKEKIFGQDEQINKIVRIIYRSKAGLNDEQKPFASLLLVGPTGVGKTELCKQLAEEIELPFHRFDMSEFQEKHSVSKFIGSPPGYVGHDQGGALVDHIRRTPHSLLLLDEIEKAHTDVFNLLLQIMDYATITDSMGRKADFRNVILCMTSNAGAESSIQSEIGFGNKKFRGSTAIMDELSTVFRPEFRNRLDDVILFNALSQREIHKIIHKELDLLKNKVRKNKIFLSWDEGIVEHLAKKGFSPIFGARSIKRIIVKEVHDVLSLFVLRKVVGNQDKDFGITLMLRNNTIYPVHKRKAPAQKRKVLTQKKEEV